ncbi:MAG: 3-deoxy-7-phosphoheptulonate synthase [Sulfolobales archaeon]
MTYKIVSREYQKDDLILDINGVEVGGNKIVIIAGPCSVESFEQVLEAAKEVKRLGAHMLRGGAFKPRTSPYSFQGLGEEGLKILAAAREETGLPIVTEVMDPRDIPLVSRYADVLQVGARNMQNFTLLRELGRVSKPVLLKRGFSASIEEWLGAAEYIAVGGNRNIILCERGIRTFETHTRFTLSVVSIPFVKKLSYLPVIADPSHATGRRDLVIPASRASIAAGADGLIVEVHPTPEKALSDGPQSITIEEFSELIKEVSKIAWALGKQI